MKPDEDSVPLQTRVPESYRDWILEQPGGQGRGGIARVLRRLIKEAMWAEQGKYTEVDNG